MNEYDSAKLAVLLEKELGLIQTSELEQADFIILNTCAVRAKAQHKIFSRLGVLRELKHHKPHLVIAVGGCMAAQEKENIYRRAPYVDMVFGPQTWQRLPQMYRELLQHPATSASTAKTIDLNFAATEKFSCLSKLTSSCSTNKVKVSSSYVSITEGCNKFCSYCVVPHTRGREASRTFGEIMDEVKNLADQGVKEIIFLGQNVNSYRSAILEENRTSGLAQIDPSSLGSQRGGKECATGVYIDVHDGSARRSQQSWSPKCEGDIATLATLVKATAKLQAISRIRFLTSHPAHFGDDLIELYKNTPKLAGHLHLPVQSGSNAVLKAMRRGYTREEYIEIVHALRCARPDIRLSTDFIVGFPQETDADFEGSLALAKEIGFDNSFSFIYSPRPSTPAAKLADDVSLSTKKQRLNILQQTLRASAEAISANMLGSRQKVIVTGLANKKAAGALELCGRTENNRIVNFAGERELLGQEVTVKITRVLTNSLRGEVA